MFRPALRTLLDVPALPSVHVLLDLCFPPCCLACDRPAWEEGNRVGGVLCRACRVRRPPALLRCPACGRRTGPHGAAWSCPACTGDAAEHDALRWSGTPAALGRRALRGVVAAWSYTGPPRDLVLALKFRGRPEAAGLLVPGVVEALRRARVPGDLVVPIPLSPRRRRKRGYDQARRLARPLARALGLPLRAGALRRIRHTAPQSGLPTAARRRGPRGAFAARTRPVAGRCVILVDDVLTSGATAWACALALRRAGAVAVTAAVACRAERRRMS